MIYSIIPARGGSKGVHDKNMKLLCGYPLMAYSIVASILCGKISRTIVSTDSEKIADMALRFGAEVPFLRPEEFARDNSADIEFMLHAIRWFQDNEDSVPQYMVHLRPTTPLREPLIVERALNTLLENETATSLRSGHPASESPFKWFLLKETGYFTSIHPDYSNEYINKPRQSFPTVYIPDGYVDVVKTSFILESKILHGEKMVGFVSPVCREVDTIEDFDYIEFELSQKGSSLFDYMKTKYPQEV